MSTPLPPAISMTDIAERGRAWLTREHREHAVPVILDAPPDGDQDDLPGSARYLSVVEIVLPVTRGALNVRDYLFLSIVETDGAATTVAPAQLHLLTPSAMRSHAVAVERGTRISGMPVTILPLDVCRLSAVLLAIRRTAESRRILDALESLAATLDHARSDGGMTALARAILDRLEILRDATDVTVLAGGTHLFAGAAKAGAHPHHLAFLASSPERPREDLYIIDEHLCAGPTRETSSPLRDQALVLMRVGRTPVCKDSSRSPDQLRRQYALIQTGVAAAREGESYQNKARRLRLANRLTSLYGAAALQRLPAVTPIIVEAAPDLKPLLATDDDSLAPALAKQVDAMRSELRSRYGFDIPGIRFRLNEGDLLPGAYVIMLREIPLIMDYAHRDLGFCLETGERLALLGIDGDTAFDPVTRRDGCWIDRDHWKTATDAGLTVWGADEFLMRHLTEVLRRNLVDLAGLQMVAQLVDEKADDRAAGIRWARGGLSRFTAAIHMLLSEQVSIAELTSICDCFLEHQDRPMYEIVEEIRCLEVVRISIPANTSRTAVYRVGPRLAALIEGHMERDRDTVWLSLPPESTQDVLAAVRAAVGAPASSAVLWVDDWRIRRLLKRLLEIEFPDALVLSRREAVDPDAMPVLGTIEVEP